MKKLWILAMFVGCLGAAQGQKNFIDQNYIQLQAYAEKEVVPNEIYLSIQINDGENKGKDEVAELELKMVDKLKQIGVDIKKQLVIADFSNTFKAQFLRKPDIQASKQYQLLLYDTQTLALVYMHLEEIGIGNIQVVKVNHSDMDEIKSTVRIQAMKNARKNATDLANSLGQDVGRAIMIRQIENYRPINKEAISYRVALDEMPSKQNIPDIEFEKIKIEYRADVYFELK